MPPALRALLAQALAWLLCLGLGRAGLLPPGLLALVLAQALGAAGISLLLGCAPWWRWIHLGFTPLLAGAWSLHLAPGWYLGAFGLLALVYWSSFRTQVPLFLSNPTTARAVAGLLPDRPAFLLDLGSGTGSLVRPLARLRPDCRFEGVESAPAPYLLSWLLSRHQPNVSLARGDFWEMPWEHYDLVYAFLSPVPMAQVWAKASAEMRPGSLLVSNSFPIPDLEPDQIIQVPDRRGTLLYCYRPAGGPVVRRQPKKPLRAKRK
jgi:hypothetical protein